MSLINGHARLEARAGCAVDFTRPQSSHSFFRLSPARSGRADRGRSRCSREERLRSRENGKNLPVRGPLAAPFQPDSFTARTESTDRMRPNGHVKSRVRPHLIIYRFPMGPLNQARWQFIGRYPSGIEKSNETRIDMQNAMPRRVQISRYLPIHEKNVNNYVVTDLFQY
jgi:hypothetical protein